MIPASPHQTESRAELRVFDQLRRAFDGDARSRFTAFHSLNLTHHDYKRFGEIDFLVVGRPGIFVLEVKGGGVSCEAGEWRYQDRFGVGHSSVEGPFRQAESALHGLRSKLEKGLSRRVLDRFTVGCGVVFPDCDWTVSGVEWDPEMLADARSARNLEGWLERLFTYWRRRETRRHSPPEDADLDALIRFLRPDFEMAVPIHVRVSEVEEHRVALTEDQMWAVDLAEENNRLLCAGGAGTGKTFLAMELARRWTAQGRKVLLACRSSWLRRWLQARFMVPGLAVAVADGAATAARRMGIDRFDALIVDEGQDLLDLTLLEGLDTALVGGLEEGRWCFFHDLNNQAGLFGEPDPEALELISQCATTRVVLRKNCRNTQQILGHVQSSLGADMGERGTGDGPEVVDHRASDEADAARLLASEIERILDRGGLLDRDLTILSPRPLAESAARLLPPKVLSRLISLDEYSLNSFPPEAISFAGIDSFKGLENEAVIVLDLPVLANGRASAEHYVAMSRARSVLSVIYAR